MSDNLGSVVYKMALEKFSPSISVCPTNFYFLDCSIPMHHPGADTIGPYLTSFPSALQLRVSFGLLNNQPPFLSSLICSDDEASKGKMKK
jgi:hypothetical protein